MRNIKRLSIVASVILLVGIIGSVLTYTSAKSNQGWEKEERSFGNEVMNIDIQSSNTNVEVMSTDGQDITLEYNARNIDDQLTAEVTDQTLTIQIQDKSNKWFNFGLFLPERTLKVFVPQKSYHHLKIENDNGHIELNNFQGERIILNNDNGKVDMTHVEGSIIEADLDNGQVGLEHVLADEVNVNTSNGRIVLTDVEANITGKTNNGSILLETVALDKEVDFYTDNGRIKIKTEQKPTNAILDLRVDNGRINVFGESNWDTVFGEGEHLIKLVTNNGGITIEN